MAPRFTLMAGSTCDVGYRTDKSFRKIQACVWPPEMFAPEPPSSGGHGSRRKPYARLLFLLLGFQDIQDWIIDGGCSAGCFRLLGKTNIVFRQDFPFSLQDRACFPGSPRTNLIGQIPVLLSSGHWRPSVERSVIKPTYRRAFRSCGTTGHFKKPLNPDFSGVNFEFVGFEHLRARFDLMDAIHGTARRGQSLPATQTTSQTTAERTGDGLTTTSAI